MQVNRNLLLGLVLAVLSSAAFGTSGALAKGLLASGWTPAAAVTWRVIVGALTLAVPAVLSMRGKWHTLRKGWPTVALFGLIAIALCQLAYFLAVERLSVGVALLLEYSGVLLVILWLWLRYGFRPRRLTVAGAALSVVGLVLTLNVFGSLSIDPVGVFWGLVAAAGLAVYFIIAADTGHGIPPLFVAGGGLAVGAVVLVVAGAIGIVPIEWNTMDVQLAGVSVPWWLDVAILGVVAAAFAYLSGIEGSSRLGSKLASFVGLSEVLFAVFWAWLLLGEMPAPIQLAGGALILAGVAVVRLDERPPAAAEPSSAVRHPGG